jgi:hypothetical protein
MENFNVDKLFKVLEHFHPELVFKPLLMSITNKITCKLFLCFHPHKHEILDTIK